MRDVKLFSKRDILFFAVLLLICGAMFLALSRSGAGAAVVIEHDGEQVLRRELASVTEEQDIAVEGENGETVVVRLSPGGAQVISSGCRDQVCVRSGLLTRAGQSAICLPARVSVRLEGAGQADAETY